jgi:hypothetical protein
MAYQKVGIEATPEFITEEEINKRIKSNNFDAIVSKISDEKSIKNGVKIFPPLIKNYKVYRWTLKSSPPRGKRYSIGAIKGVLAHSKAIIKNRAKFTGVQYFKNYKSMVSAIENKKIDSILLSNLEYQNELNSELQKKFKKSQKELLSISLHHYVNEKHKAIIPKLESEFKRLEAKKELRFEDFEKTYKLSKTE